MTRRAGQSTPMPLCSWRQGLPALFDLHLARQGLLALTLCLGLTGAVSLQAAALVASATPVDPFLPSDWARRLHERVCAPC